MKKPKEPKAPIEPIAPSKTIKIYDCKHITDIFSEDIKIDDLYEKIISVQPLDVQSSNITLSISAEECYNNSCYACGGFYPQPVVTLRFFKEVNNPEYDVQLAKYFIDNEAYKAKLIDYNSALITYNSLKLEYDNLQRNKINKDKIKELENLKKQVIKLEREIV